LLESVRLFLPSHVLLLAEPRVELLSLKLATELGLFCSRTYATFLHPVVTLRTKHITLLLEVTFFPLLLGLQCLLLLSLTLGLLVDPTRLSVLPSSGVALLALQHGTLTHLVGSVTRRVLTSRLADEVCRILHR